jgi:hypothetical protein
VEGDRDGPRGLMLKGGCLCGAVRYEADGPVFHETICHCVDCRRAVGAANVAWFSVKTEGFRFSSGAPALFRSSAKVSRQFCATCGTSLTYQYDDRTDEIDITIASLDTAELMPPKDHSQVGDRLAWDLLCDDLPRFDRFRSS